MNRIDKFKVNKDGGVTIKWSRPNGKDFDEFSLRSWDEPATSLLEALTALAPDLLALCELEVNQENLDRTKVTGVSFSYSGDNDTLGAVITAQRKLFQSNGVLIINTPHKVEEPVAEGAEADLLDPECAMHLGVLMDEIRRYIDGHRAQQNLFAPQESEETVSA